MKKVVILISIILLLVINIAPYSNSARNEFEQYDNKQPAKSSKVQTTKDNNVSKPNITSQIQGVSNTWNQKQQTAGEYEHNWYDKLLSFTITDCLLAIFSGLLVYFSYRLWKTTHGLWKASQDQCGVMNRQVDSVEKMARQQLRAFIFGKGFGTGPNILGEKIKEYVFWVIFENEGLTPGIDVCSWIQFKTLQAGKDEIAFVPSEQRVNIVLGPRATARTAYVTIPLETMMQRWRNEISIFIWFRVEYKDVFDSAISHHHEQCASIELIHDPSAIPPQGHVPYVEFRFYGKQNSVA